jgi:hypothetical protein
MSNKKLAHKISFVVSLASTPGLLAVHCCQINFLCASICALTGYCIEKIVLFFGAIRTARVELFIYRQANRSS